MAQILFQSTFASDSSKTIESAGLAAMVGHPADPHVQTLLKTQNLDGSQHRARQVTTEMFLKNDLILVMDQQQRQEIQYHFPSVCGKVHLLGKWGGFEVPDPYKKSFEDFENCFQLIRQGVEEWKTRLWK